MNNRPMNNQPRLQDTKLYPAEQHDQIHMENLAMLLGAGIRYLESSEGRLYLFMVEFGYAVFFPEAKQYIQEHKINVNRRIMDDGTRLIGLAVHSEQHAVIEFLIQEGAELEYVTEAAIAESPAGYRPWAEPRNVSSLQSAARSPRNETMAVLLKHNHLIRRESINKALLVASGRERINQTEAIELLLSAKADINYQDEKGMTALHCAMQCSQLATACLLKHDARVDLKNNAGQTAFDVLCSSIFCDATIELLLKHKNLIKKEILSEALVGEIWHRQSPSNRKVELLLDAGADINYSTPWAGTALQCAARRNARDVVYLLMKHNARMDIKDQGGKTALELITCDDLRSELMLKIYDDSLQKAKTPPEDQIDKIALLIAFKQCCEQLYHIQDESTAIFIRMPLPLIGIIVDYAVKPNSGEVLNIRDRESAKALIQMGQLKIKLDEKHLEYCMGRSSWNRLPWRWD